MSRSYTPGSETDAIIDRQIAKGNFSSHDEAVRSAVRLLELREAELAELRRLIEEGDAAFAAGDVYRYAGGKELADDIIARGAVRSKQRR